MTNLVASADTKLSIGSCPIGCTAYTWSAGIADVINNNVEGVSLTAEETKDMLQILSHCKIMN